MNSPSYIAAPMVNQDDLPIRVLVRRYGATLAYTQMLSSERLLNDQDYLEFHQRDLTSESATSNGNGATRPVVVQLCGNDPETIVGAGRKLQMFCDGIDLNLGCPQTTARDGHFGAYLLGQKDWLLVTDIVLAMSHSLTVPVSTKLRLCQPASKTLDFARRLEASGASWIALHARHVSASRRRQGAADLAEVKRLKDNLRVPVITNGNVRVWADVQENQIFTGADGVMVGEALLRNPCLFANIDPDPVAISLEYLDLCGDYPGTFTISTVSTHIRHFIDFQCHRRPWFRKFRVAVNACQTLDEFDVLLRTKVTRWRGKAGVDGIEVSGETDEGGEIPDCFEDL